MEKDLEIIKRKIAEKKAIKIAIILGIISFIYFFNWFESLFLDIMAMQPNEGTLLTMIFSGLITLYIFSIIYIELSKDLFKCFKDDMIDLNLIENKTENISFLPNQVVNIDSNMFIINQEVHKFNLHPNVKFIEDSKNNPYIIVEDYKCSINLSNNKLLTKKDVEKLEKKFSPIQVVSYIHY